MSIFALSPLGLSEEHLSAFIVNLYKSHKVYPQNIITSPNSILLGKDSNACNPPNQGQLGHLVEGKMSLQSMGEILESKGNN